MWTKEQKNAWQREHRRNNANIETRRYEKTKSGFLMRCYRNMKSRVTGVQKTKYHLYQDKTLLPKIDFYQWANADNEFHRLFREWELSGYDIKFTPSVDRIDSQQGYELENIEWVTQSENSRRGSANASLKRQGINIGGNYYE